jgi:hypothetical protein
VPKICGFAICGLIIKFADLRFADWHTKENLQIHDDGMSLKNLQICDLQTLKKKGCFRTSE